MQLTEDSNQSSIRIQKYSDHSIQINDKPYQDSILISTSAVEIWPVQQFSEISAALVEKIILRKPDIVIIGSGKQFQRLPQTFQQQFHQHKIGVESMDTGAACRTFAALASEGRRVIAALIIEKNK